MSLRPARRCSVLLAAALLAPFVALGDAPAAHADPVGPPGGTPGVHGAVDDVGVGELDAHDGGGVSAPARPDATRLRAAGALAALTAPLPGRLLPGTLDPRPVYAGQVSCDPIDKPGAVALGRLLVGTYGVGTFGVSRWCDGTPSEHSEGRAVDWMLDSTKPAEKAVGDAATAWLAADGGENARRLGVMYVIWNRKMWRAYAPERGWSAYTGPNPHVDHVHLSLTWDGATQRTSWWSGRVASPADLGPCRVRTGQFAPIWSAPRTGACFATTPAPASTMRTYVPGQRHTDIARAQSLLGVAADSSFGYGTRRAVLDYQARQGLPRTGVLDPDTWGRLLGGAPATPSPAPAAPATPTPAPPTTPAPVPPARPAPAPAATLRLPASVPTRYTPYATTVLRAGSRGPAVRVLQRGLHVRETGVVDAATLRAVRTLQRQWGLRATGVVDRRTWNRLELRTFPWRGYANTRPAPGSSGRAVVALQQALRLRADGVFGPATKRAVVAVQTRYGLPADGVVDARTWRAVTAQGPR